MSVSGYVLIVGTAALFYWLWRLRTVGAPTEARVSREWIAEQTRRDGRS